MQGAALLDEPDSLGAFEVEGILGEGGSAIVYAARRDGQALALKVARTSALTDKEQARFLAEAELLRRVSHPSIARVLEAGSFDDGRPYLAMERLSGQTLASRITERALPLPAALELFEQIVDATSCLHGAGLVHRDLKPENVMLVDGGDRAVLIDFGIAKDADAPASTTTQAGVARGTPATMAPERFFGAPASVSSDVYELSVLLYAMLVGRLPWSDVTNVEARLNPAPPGDSVPVALTTVILRALSTRPERRPRSASELLREVRSATSSSPSSARVTAATAVLQPPSADLAPSMGQLDSAMSDGAQVLESQAAPTLPASRRGPVVAGLALLGGVLVGLLVTRVTVPEPEPLNLGLASGPVHAPAPKTAAAPNPTTPAADPAPPTTAATTVTAAPMPAPRGAIAAIKASATPEPPPPKKGKPRGAPCERSSECASMLCAAEICQ